jgi:HSP20 family protein
MATTKNNPVEGQAQGGAQERGLQQSRRQGGAMSPWADPFVSPLGFMRRMFDEMDQLMGLAPMRTGQGLERGGLFVPQVDVRRDKDRVLVRVDLPGLSPDDVKLRIEDGALLIEGERKGESESETGGVMRTERYFGQFRRCIPLPDGALADKAEARFENGVLEVSIVAPQQSPQGRNIEIQSGPAKKVGTQH